MWLQYQALWDLEPSQVYARLGDDLSRWQRLLADIRGARATFDNNDTRRSFGTIVVDYGQVQAKVNAKYDFWQREIVTRFGQRLGAAIADLFAALARARADLEEQSLESDNTADAVAFITFIGDVKRRLPGWTTALETCRAGQKLLERQRFQFPADWLYFDMVQGEWSAFSEILARKDAALQGQIGTVQGLGALKRRERGGESSNKSCASPVSSVCVARHRPSFSFSARAFRPATSSHGAAKDCAGGGGHRRPHPRGGRRVGAAQARAGRPQA